MRKPTNGARLGAAWAWAWVAVALVCCSIPTARALEPDPLAAAGVRAGPGVSQDARAGGFETEQLLKPTIKVRGIPCERLRCSRAIMDRSGRCAEGGGT